jgi:hypothetical protein
LDTPSGLWVFVCISEDATASISPGIDLHHDAAAAAAAMIV